MDVVANGLLLAAMPALLLLMAWVAYRAWGPRPVFVVMVGLVVALRLVATRFSRAVLRAFLVAAVVVSVGGLLSVGRTERIRTVARTGRAAATALAGESARARAELGNTSAADARRLAMAALGELRGLVPPPPGPGLAEPVATAFFGAVGQALGADAPDAAIRRAAELHARLLTEPELSAAGGPTAPLIRQADETLDAARRSLALAILDRADTQVAAACDAVSGTLSGGDAVCRARRSVQAGGDMKAADRRQLAVDQARAGLLVAQAVEIGGRGDAKAAAALVATRQEALNRALAAREEDTPSTDFLVVLRQGGNALVRTIPLVNRRGVPLSLATVGWVVLAGVGIMGYRHFEILNGDGGLGPVQVPGSDVVASRFRTYLLWNVPEPGAVPGATALKPVTDLLGAASGGVPGAQWLQRIIEAVTAALTIDHGYTVEFEILEEGQDGTDTTVAVRVRTTRTTELLGQHVTIQRTTKEATREAAYWAAALILSRSPKVPAWAEWDKETSESLAAYFHAPDEGTASIKLLRDAVRRAPGSGVLGLELANAESLAGNHFRAFQLALRVATMHPRYLAGRYRLAATASLIADDPSTWWAGASKADRDSLLAALDRYWAPTGRLVAALSAHPGDEQEQRHELCCFALAELGRLCRDTRTLWVMGKALRLRERSYWYALLKSPPGTKSFRVQFSETFQSCFAAIRARGGLPVGPTDLAEQERRVADPRTLWLVAYNLACYHAVRHEQEERSGSPGSVDHVAEAVRLLEIALERPAAHQLTHAWASKDPDLASLRGHQRFDRFLENLHKQEALPEIS